MADFTADIRDVKFALFEHAGFDRLYGTDKFPELDRDTAEAMLEEAYKFAKNQLAPINATLDRQGARYDPETSGVSLPPEFKEAYDLYRANGFLAVNHSPEYGGLGLPYSLSLAMNDFFFGACLTFCLEALLGTGAAHLIEVFGTDALKKLYLEKMYTGEWTGTMCLTEPGAGSDVGALRTKAKKVGDHYLIEGQKTFISFGEHDISDNIIHTVLARIEGAPAGTKGISLFVVPKYRVGDDGSIGEFNEVRCTGIEHKMGIHASPTCSMAFGENGECHGWLIGEENKGMRAMFQMMNEARISVGLQGSALANAAYQYALEYSKERVQGKDIRRLKDPEAKATTIINHPDVRQMLMWQKALSEGLRALLIRTAIFFDLAESHADEKEREKFESLVELLTPVCKAYASDQGFRSVELSLQTLGGYGYIAEYPVEQHLRDSKIASIYEGTNGIQALDLVGRKLPANGGASLRALVGIWTELGEKHAEHPVLKDAFAAFASARDALVDVSMHFAMSAAEKPLTPVLNATPYLDLFGQVTVGWLLLEQAAIAWPKLEAICKEKGVSLEDPRAVHKLCKDDPEAAFYDGKVKTAQFYASRSLLTCAGKAATLKSGDETPMSVVL